jgi:hypothetical protein
MPGYHNDLSEARALTLRTTRAARTGAQKAFTVVAIFRMSACQSRYGEPHTGLVEASRGL